MSSESTSSRSSKIERFRPAAALETLQKRAQILDGIRDFFRARGVLEVETPSLCHSGAIEEHIDPIPVPAADGFLMTSPELCMKRLLAAGSGAIFQVSRVFRQDERSPLHNPEFTLLEWYRPGFTLSDLMEEVEDLVRHTFQVGGLREAPPFRRTTYRQLFLDKLGVDPLSANPDELNDVARSRGVPIPDAGDRPMVVDDWLNLLLALCIQPSLIDDGSLFVSDYPGSQAALARIAPHDFRVAERFELYVNGIELVNGYHELSDPVEQRRRFVAANEARQRMGKTPLPMPEEFFEALKKGLPDTSGVALGLDRLVLVALGKRRLSEVIAFLSERN